MNAIMVLTEEHQKLRPFLYRLEQAVQESGESNLHDALGASRQALGKDLDHHILLEDAKVFPNIAQYLGQDMIQAFVDDHRQIQNVRDRLYSSPKNQQRSLTETLVDLLQDHLAREENMLFPSAEQAMAPEELELDGD